MRRQRYVLDGSYPRCGPRADTLFRISNHKETLTPSTPAMEDGHELSPPVVPIFLLLLAGQWVGISAQPGTSPMSSSTIFRNSATSSTHTTTTTTTTTTTARWSCSNYGEFKVKV